MTHSAPFWECSHCGKRIPRAMLSCRCGASRPSSPPARSSEAIWKVAAIGLGVTLALTLAWLNLRSSTTESSSDPVELAEAADSEAPPLTPIAAKNDVAQKPLEEVIEDVLPAVVSIFSSEGTGSGFFVDEYTVITNHHVVGGDLRVAIKLRDGATISGDVVRIAEEHDLALIRASRPLAHHTGLRLLDVDAVRVGQEVLVIGSPLGVLENSVTRGIVSAIRPSAETTVVQTDAAINPGNSGGPLIDRSGRVIGIATMKMAQGESLGFAVAADHARELFSGGGTQARGQKPLRATLETVGDVEELDADQLEIALDQVVQHYASDFKTLRSVALRCPKLNQRLSEYRGARLDYELGEIVLDYVQQHNNFARSGRRMPSWSDVSCLTVRVVEKCYEGIQVYDATYKVYVHKRAQRGRPATLKRYFPEI